MTNEWVSSATLTSTATPIPTPTATPTGMVIFDFLIIAVIILITSLLIAGGVLLALRIKDRVEQRITAQDEEMRAQIRQMRVWTQDNDSTRQPSRRGRNIAETRDEGRAGVCTACNRVRKLQKCYDAEGKMSRLCNDCLYTGKQELKDREEVYATMFGNWDL